MLNISKFFMIYYIEKIKKKDVKKKSLSLFRLFRNIYFYKLYIIYNTHTCRHTPQTNIYTFIFTEGGIYFQLFILLLLFFSFIFLDIIFYCVISSLCNLNIYTIILYNTHFILYIQIYVIIYSLCTSSVNYLVTQ